MRKLIALFCAVILISPAYAQFCDPPGETVGLTGYPVQSSGMATNRIGYDTQNGVHITWMSGTSLFDRGVRYNFRDENGQWLSDDGMPVNAVGGAGYPSLALKSDDAAVVSYHNMSNNYVNLAVDAFRGMAIFEYYDPPDLGPSGNHAFWPQVAVSANGDYHVLMVEHTQEQGEYPAMIYSRSTDGGQSWTSPATVAEVALLNGCITASADGKVAIVYLLPDRTGEFSQVKNDVAYVVSEDGRSWDFSRPENLTEYADDDLEIYCPWGIDAVFDSDDDLNITWVTGHIGDDGFFLDETAQLWYYGQTNDEIILLAESTDDLLDCTYGAVTLPIAMPSISFGNQPFPDWKAFQVSYIGYDESDASHAGECLGDIYMVFGWDIPWGGMGWYEPINLTESHSNGCQPGDCLSENFATTAEAISDSVHLTYVMQNLGDDQDNVYYLPVHISVMNGIPGGEQLPGSFELLGNYPNPFNNRTVIEFEMENAADVRLTVYDITGALVEVLHDGHLDAGKQSIAWNGKGVASGAYFYKLATADGSRVRKMVLLK